MAKIYIVAMILTITVMFYIALEIKQLFAYFYVFYVINVVQLVESLIWSVPDQRLFCENVMLCFCVCC